MSAWELTQTEPRTTPAESARPRLSRVAAARPHRLSGLPFAGLMILLLALGMVGLLALNTYLQDQSFQMQAAQRQANELGHRVSDLEAQVARAEAPAQIAGRASELGMVPNPYPVYLDVATGKVTGVPRAVRGGEFPSLRVEPTGGSQAGPTPTPSITVTTKVVPWINLPKTSASKPSASASPAKKAGAAPSKSTKAKPTTRAAAAKPTAKKTTTR